MPKARAYHRFLCSTVRLFKIAMLARSTAVPAHYKLIYDRVAGWLPNHDRAQVPKIVGGIMARVEITFAVYRPPTDDLPHLVVVIADGKVIVTESVKSFQEGEDLVDYLSRELLKAAPPRG